MRVDTSRPNIRAGNLKSGGFKKKVKPVRKNELNSRLKKKNDDKFRKFGKPASTSKYKKPANAGKFSKKPVIKKKSAPKVEKKKSMPIPIRYLPMIGLKPDGKFVFSEEGLKNESTKTGYAKCISNSFGNPKRPVYIYSDIEKSTKPVSLIFHVKHGDYVASVGYDANKKSIAMYVFQIRKNGRLKIGYKTIFTRKKSVEDDFENTNVGILGKIFDQDLITANLEKLLPLVHAACSKSIMPKLMYSYLKPSRLAAN